jgi:electron transfer flavoprotein alpha subunit
VTVPPAGVPSANVAAGNSFSTDVLALVVCRDGRLPAGADEAVAEAGGAVFLVGTGAEAAAASLVSATAVWCSETSTLPAGLARGLAHALSDVSLIVLPASPDGRDLAPRLSAEMGRPLLAGAIRVRLGECAGGPTNRGARADLLRADGSVVVPVDCVGPAIATLMPGARGPAPTSDPPPVTRITFGPMSGQSRDAEILALLEPDPATMDLADATKVLGGGAGLVPRGASDEQARAVFSLLAEVAAALGGSAGATRVVTDAAWMAYDRQIGTTGVAIDPDLYVAFGVSGATQHVGGLGSPEHTVSVNTDPSCPMTAMANLGLVADAGGVLVELAVRLGVSVPGEVEEALHGPHTVA